MPFRALLIHHSSVCLRWAWARPARAGMNDLACDVMTKNIACARAMHAVAKFNVSFCACACMLLLYTDEAVMVGN